MVHLRIVAPHDLAAQVIELLDGAPTACHLVHLEGVSRSPPGDMILVDVPREDASVIVGDLKELHIHEQGSISVEPIEVQLSELAEEAERRSPGAPADAVVWEEVEARTSEQARLSWSYLVFMVLAALLTGVGILLDSPVLIIGGMVVGPEFGPIAAFCVAFVERRLKLAAQGLLALVVGLPLAVVSVLVAMLAFRATGVAPDEFDLRNHSLSNSIANPDVLSFFVAVCAGTAGILSLSTAKSGALIGVLISVATIPSASNVGVAAAYADWTSFRGSLAQLGINVAGILLAGVTTLWVQRMIYRRRRLKHLKDPARAEAGLPVGHSARDGASATPPATTTPRASSGSAR